MYLTLYHPRGEGWQRTVIPDLWARWDRGISHSPGWGRTDESDSLILIPCRPDLEIAPGDGILEGEGPEVTPGALKNQLPEVRIVRQAALHRPGSPLDHWEVLAR